MELDIGHDFAYNIIHSLIAKSGPNQMKMILSVVPIKMLFERNTFQHVIPRLPCYTVFQEEM